MNSQPDGDRVAFLRNVTGFGCITREVEPGLERVRWTAVGRPALREPTHGVKVLTLTLLGPLAPIDRAGRAERSR